MQVSAHAAEICPRASTLTMCEGRTKFQDQPVEVFPALVIRWFLRVEPDGGRGCVCGSRELTVWVGEEPPRERGGTSHSFPSHC